MGKQALRAVKVTNSGSFELRQIDPKQPGAETLEPYRNAWLDHLKAGGKQALEDLRSVRGDSKRAYQSSAGTRLPFNAVGTFFLTTSPSDPVDGYGDEKSQGL